MAMVEVDFTTPEELTALLEEIGLKLHAKNRISGSESGVVWHLTEAIRSVGQLATRIVDDPEMHGLYGDGYQSGRMAEDSQRAHFLEMLREAYLASK